MVTPNPTPQNQLLFLGSWGGVSRAWTRLTPAPPPHSGLGLSSLGPSQAQAGQDLQEVTVSVVRLRLGRSCRQRCKTAHG